MTTNPYVRWWNDTREQSLLQFNMTEAISLYGLNVIYLPRAMRRADVLYNEDILSQFSLTYPIEVYVKDISGWAGQGDFLSKFGIQVKDHINIMVSRPRFTEAVPQMRPMEGDLVYFPAPFNIAFEIKWVEHEKAGGGQQFYTLGKLTYYELQLERFVYGQEHFATGNTAIDSTEANQAYSQILSFAAGSGTFSIGETVYQGAQIVGSPAIAIVSAWNSSTKNLTVTDIRGVFNEIDVVKGATSGASYILSGLPDTIEIPNDHLNDNRYLLDQSLDIIDNR